MHASDTDDDPVRAAAVAAATDAERLALSDFLKMLLRAHAAITELVACCGALPDIVSRINNARRITGNRPRFAPAFIPTVQPHVVGRIEQAANAVYARVGADADEPKQAPVRTG